MWYPIRVDIAVVGQSRIGKSSFINAILGAPVANVGHLEDCTTEVTEYSVPHNPNIKIFDSPGISPTECSREQFAEKIQLDSNLYDAFFIVIKDTFSEDAEFVRKKVAEKGRPFFVVRTHADDTAKKFYNTNESREATDERVSERIRNYLKTQIAKLGGDSEGTNIYIVDNYNTSQFDFPKLMEDLSRNLPEVKAQQFLLTIISFDLAAIERKYNELWWSNKKWALTSGIFGLSPIPGTNVAADIGILAGGVVKFLSAFGISKEQIFGQEKLHRMEKGILEKQLTKTMKQNKYDVLLAVRDSPYFNENLKVSSANIKKIAPVILRLLGGAILITAADDVLKATGFFAMFGMVLGAVTSFSMTWYLLDRELSNAKSCALYVSALIDSHRKAPPRP